MAQTKTNTRKTNTSRGRKSSTSTRARATKSSRSQAKSSRSQAKQNGAPSAGRAQTSSTRRSEAPSVKESVIPGAQGAIRGVTRFTQKAKGPLLTGGAALAGVTGAVVLTARSRRRRKVLGVTLPKLKLDAQKVTDAITDAAKSADRLGQRVSRVASGVQDVSETANAVAKKS